MEKVPNELPKLLTPEVVLKYKEPTSDFLCRLSANIYNIKFLAFKIRDYDSNQVFFEIKREAEDDIENPEENIPNFDENEYRTIRYHFGPNFFKLKKIGTTLGFSVGDKPVKNFRMIERHYFKKQLIQNFDFLFPFCMPNSTNTWEAIYEIPNLDEETQKDMINCPWETKSDSFYFVGNELVMHNKAEYNFSPDLEMDEDEID